jgi:hypothetical protein
MTASPEEPIRLQRETKARFGRKAPQRAPEPVMYSARVHVETTYGLLLEARKQAARDVDKVEERFHAAILDALRAGVSQLELADLLGLSKQRMSQITAEIRQKAREGIKRAREAKT